MSAVAWIVYIQLLIFAQLSPHDANPEWVISGDNSGALTNAIQAKKHFISGDWLKSMKIEKDHAVLCYEGKTSAAWCVTVLHKSAVKNLKPIDTIQQIAGEFTIRHSVSTKNKAVRELIKRLQSYSGKPVWTKIVPTKSNNAGQNLANIIENALDEDNLLLAEELLDIAKELKVSTSRLNWLRVRLYSEQGDFEKSNKLSISLPTSSEDGGLPVLEAARRDILQGKIDAGLDKLNLFPERNEASKELICSLSKLATLLEKRKKISLAKELLEKLAAKFDDCDAVWQALGRIKRNLGESEDFLLKLEPVLLKRPENIALLTAKAETLRRLKKFKPLLLLWLKLYNLSGEKTFITLYSTTAAQNPHDEEKYLALKKRYTKNPENLAYAHAFGVLNYYRANYKAVIPIMDKLLVLLPDDPRVYIYSAMSRYELGDWDGARKLLEKLETVKRVDPDLYYCLAVLYHRKDPVIALNYLDQYFAYPPHSDDFMPKRMRALKSRQLLEERKEIPNWLPHVEKEKLASGCKQNSSHVNNGILLGFGMLLLIRRNKKRQQTC